MAEDMGERTESPTDKRLSDARQRGQIARSQDLSSAALLLTALLGLAVLGAPLVRGMASFMRTSLDEGILGPVARPDDARLVVIDAIAKLAIIAGPALAVMFVAAYAAHVVQVGWLLSGKPLVPSFSRLNVIKGLGKLFSRRNLVKGVVNIFKVALVAMVATLVIRSDFLGVVSLPRLTLGQGLVFFGGLILKLALWLLAILLMLGLIDYIYQRWQHQHDLRMTKQEVKDERKSSEGDPMVKARRMRIARQIAMQRLRSDVPRADVVVTNPTHYAVALKYDAAAMKAPKVVAKGADYMAMQIRLIAASHGVPIVERPALARALYAAVEVGREIPVEQYEAVAELLAYVYRIEGRAAS
ncbi:MAG: flagellar biosynthesis protein FlhB [Phycisphaerales bacterium]|nr:flagellar biosynthesis protein FlhB [Phycisphaerales bacterium]